MFAGLGTAPICVDAETYGYCAGNTGGQYNFDGLFDFQRYDDPDRNPYVVGSAAWRAARGLPPPEAAYPERTFTAGVKLPDTISQSAAQAASGSVAAPTVAVTPGVAPTLSWGAIAIAAAVLWFAVK